jgi:hypothetical protein
LFLNFNGFIISKNHLQFLDDGAGAAGVFSGRGPNLGSL